MGNHWNRLRYTPVLPLGEDGRTVTASKEHLELSRAAASEGMVLLKNENHVLPLERGAKVALFGKGTADYVKGGGGSGDVTVPYCWIHRTKNSCRSSRRKGKSRFWNLWRTFMRRTWRSSIRMAQSPE